MKKIYAFLAQGFEETEALMVIDLMRRSHTIDVVTVSVTDELMVESSHKVNIKAEILILMKETEFFFREVYRAHLILRHAIC